MDATLLSYVLATGWLHRHEPYYTVTESATCTVFYPTIPHCCPHYPTLAGRDLNLVIGSITFTDWLHYLREI